MNELGEIMRNYIFHFSKRPDLIFDFQIDLMSASHSGSHQQQTRRVKRFSAFDNFFLRDIMDMFSGSDGGLLTPSR